MIRDESDERLVASAREGDERALDLLIRRHHATAFRLALGIVRDEDLAADVAQDAFVKMVRALDRFRGDARFRTWLLTIVSNEAKGALRKKNRRRESSFDESVPVADSAPALDDQVVARTEGERLRRELRRLPQKQRLAVELRLDEGLGFREIGELIGSSEGAARVNYHHGVKKLRMWMSEVER